MPGHVKAGKAGEKDPDPEPYLVVTMEMKREDQKKPYDSKKSYWCPDGKGGYAECMLENKGDVESSVMLGHIVSNEYLSYFSNDTKNYILFIFIQIWNMLKYYFFDNYIFRKRFVRQKSLVKSTLQSLRNVRTWLTLLI